MPGKCLQWCRVLAGVFGAELWHMLSTYFHLLLSSPLTEYFMQPVLGIQSSGKCNRPMVSSQVSQVSPVVPFSTIFLWVVGPGLSFPYKAFFAEPSLLGSLKGHGRLLAITSEEGQWRERKTTGPSTADISLCSGTGLLALLLLWLQ